MTPDLRTRCFHTMAKCTAAVSIDKEIEVLAQLYHDGYRAGLEEAAVESMHAAQQYLHEAESAVKHKDDKLWAEMMAKQKACRGIAAEIRQRATKLKQEPTS